MLAAVRFGSRSTDALPVCLGRENSNRLVSLWNIVNQYNVGGLCATLLELERAWIEAGVAARTKRRSLLNARLAERIAELVYAAGDYCDGVGFETGSHASQMASIVLRNRSRINMTTLESEVNHVKNGILKDVVDRRFLCVAKDRSDYIDQEELFGAKVFRSFPSARQDIKEAGNCLAADCSTAAVFHLMRAVEHGLRALAWDRRVRVPKRLDLDLATWEEIIRELEKAEGAIQNYPKTTAREAQFNFHHGAMMQFRAFKNKFRNSIMHTRDAYDPNESHGVFRQVRDFMQILSSRISERTRTPRIWRGKKWTTVQA